MNKKSCKIIRINGFRGLLLAIFIGSCLLTGFIVCPGWVFMHIWNYTASFFLTMPRMDLVQGVILWAIIALSIYGLNGNRFLVGYSSAPTLNEDQIKSIMERVKTAAAIEPKIEQTTELENKEETFEEVRK